MAGMLNIYKALELGDENSLLCGKLLADLSMDVIIESFPPGYMKSLGLGYSNLRRLNFGLIMVSITPFG